MYFWKYKQLAQDFINDKVTERQKLLYILTPAMYVAFALFINLIKTTLSMKNTLNFLNIEDGSLLKELSKSNLLFLNIFSFSDAIFVLLIMLIAYKINSKSDNKDLIARYFAFRFIALIRTIALVMILSILLIFIKGNTINELYLYLLPVLVISMIYLYYVQIVSFLYLKRYFLSVKKATNKTTKKLRTSRKEDKKKYNRIIKKMG